MNLNNFSPKQKIIIISIGIVLVASLLIVIFFRPSNKYGDEVSINGYDKYISNLPDDRKDALNATLYNIIKVNSNSDNIKTITDANIRSGSVVSDYDDTKKIYTGSFIVDIQSISQSYMMSYLWSPVANSSYLSGYTATASCLSVEKLTYGEFDCKDDFNNSPTITKRDPIINFLPYSTYNYTISADNDNRGSVGLNVTIFLYSSDTRDNGTDAAINKYKSQVVEWIKSKKLNPSDYTIIYTIE